MSTPSARLLSALALCAAALALPRAAQACDPDPCQYTETWVQFSLVNEAVGTDGVLVFDARRGPDAGQFTDAEALAFVEVEVLADGQPITGALELDEDWHGVVWRPDAALPANAELSISLVIDNASLEGDICNQEPPPAGPFVLGVGAGPTPSFDFIQDAIQAEYELRDLEELESMVCCDEAYPVIEEFCGPDLYWSEGHCEFSRAVGRADTDWAWDFASLEPELRGVLSWRVVTQEQGNFLARPQAEIVKTNFDQVICGHIEVLNRASGELVVQADDICPGEGFQDQLGLRELDRSEALAMACTGTPYVCAVIEGDFGPQWDPNDCEEWSAPGGDGDGDGDGGTDSDGETGGDAGLGGEGGGEGCSCSASEGTAQPFFGLALLGLLGLVRRRERAAD